MKKDNIGLIVIGTTIIMLLIVLIGSTFAYFTSLNNKGSTSVISVTSGKMTISYADGNSKLLSSKDIVPSDKILIDKTFSLTGTNTTSGLAMPYRVGLKYISEFSDGQIHYYVKRTNTNANVTSTLVGTANQTIPGNTTETGYTHGTLKKGNKYQELATGEFKANTSNQTITFNLKIQFPDTGVSQDSEKRKTLTGEIVVNYEPPKATTFASDSWETIAAVVQYGKIDAYPVGAEKEVEIGGTSYTVRVANNTTPEKCNQDDFSQTACGFVVEFVDIVETKQMNSSRTNVGGWPASEMRTYVNGDFFNKLPSDLRNVIIETKVVAGHGKTSGETNFTSIDKIYLLSVHEVYEDDGSPIELCDTAYNNTRQLDYYKNKGVTTSNCLEARKKPLDSSSYDYWWLRAASSHNDIFFYVADFNGEPDDYPVDNSFGVSPAFRIG